MKRSPGVISFSMKYTIQKAFFFRKRQKNKKQVQFIEVGGVGAGQGLIDYITNNSEVHTRGP